MHSAHVPDNMYLILAASASDGVPACQPPAAAAAVNVHCRLKLHS